MPPTRTRASFFGEVPVQPPHETPQPTLTPHEAALIAQTCTKTGVVWVRLQGGNRFHPAWHVWQADAIHLVFGIGEQMLPLLSGVVVEVAAASKDTRQRLVTFTAMTEVLAPRSTQWEAAATALAARRLNAAEPALQLERWAAGSLITRLIPLTLLNAGGGDDTVPVGTITPPVTPATTVGRRPFHLGGRTRRAARLAASGSGSG